jgi:hypothetical protein
MRSSSPRPSAWWLKSCAGRSEDHHRLTQRSETTAPPSEGLASEDELSRHVLDQSRRDAVLVWLAEMVVKAVQAEGESDDRSRQDPAGAS